MSGTQDRRLDADEMNMLGAKSPCSYLPDRTSLMQYRFAMSLTTERYQHLLERGWRRFGRTLFRPVCQSCSECRSLRIELVNFRPTKSQRKIRNRNSDIELQIGRLSLTQEHLDLYNRYHLDMHNRRDWAFREITADQYFESFIDGEFSFSREFQYRLHGKLVGLGIVDMTGNVMSSIYFVHDPDLRDRGLGTMSILREIDAGANSQHSGLYMGYYIRDCGSMNYKNRFGPHQILQGYVADDEPAVWQLPESRGEQP
jgi:arginyl-tRNA--protein-N-Asp/Glu arginylyltransferase